MFHNRFQLDLCQNLYASGWFVVSLRWQDSLEGNDLLGYPASLTS